MTLSETLQYWQPQTVKKILLFNDDEYFVDPNSKNKKPINPQLKTPKTFRLQHTIESPPFPPHPPVLGHNPNPQLPTLVNLKDHATHTSMPQTVLLLESRVLIESPVQTRKIELAGVRLLFF